MLFCEPNYHINTYVKLITPDAKLMPQNKYIIIVFTFKIILDYDKSYFRFVEISNDDHTPVVLVEKSPNCFSRWRTKSYFENN